MPTGKKKTKAVGSAKKYSVSAKSPKKAAPKKAPPKQAAASKPKRAPKPKALKAIVQVERAPVSVRPSFELAVPRDAITFAASKIRDIADYPREGITFKDVTPLLANPKAFHIVLDVLAERFIGEQIDTIVGIDARGFIFGGALAARLNAAFVPARKPGKLPAETDSVTYKTEYSIDTLEMHRDAIVQESRVIIVDDVLATGGTAKAAADLVKMQGGYLVAHAFVIELSFLGGREKLLPVKVESVIRY